MPVQAANTPISTLIYDYGINESSTVGMVTNLVARQTAAGNTPTVNTAVGTSIDLSSYGQVWDLGANVAFTSDQIAYYTAYLQNGGTLFVMGENAGWGANRNNSISSLLSSLGGGTVTVTGNSPNSQTIVPQFLVANQNANVTFAAIGAFSSVGTGTCITSGCGAAAWGVGTLANAPKGALISVLDVNFLGTPYLAQDFTDNLIAYLFQQQQISEGNAKTDIVDTTGTAQASQLGTSLNYRFDGGVLIADQDVTGGFTVTGNGGGIVYAGTDRTFSGVFSDDGNTAPGSIVISNSGSGGSLILGADNTFSGGFTVLSGAQLQIDRAGELGSGTLHLIGSATSPAYLRVTGTTTIANAITVAGDPVFDVASGTTTTITGVIADGGSAGDLVKTGAGALVLTATNTYTGPTTITAGTLALSGTGSIATSSGVAVEGVFDIAATTAGAAIQNLTGTGSVVLGAQTLSLSGASNAFGGAISGTGGLTLASGAAVLTGTNTYTGATTIAAGTLALSGTGSIATSSGVAVEGVFDIAATTAGAAIQNLTGTGSVVLGARTLSLSGASNAFGGAISGTGGLTLASGAVVLTGSNIYTGPTTITAGTLQIGNGGTSGSLASASIVDNGTLVFNRSDAVSYAGVITGSGTLTKAAAGTLTLTGANTYTGPTAISAGTLQIGDGGTTGAIVSASIVNNGALVFNRADAVTYGGVISGTGTLTKLGAGTLLLTGTNTYSGLTTIAAGIVQVGDASHTTAQIAGAVQVGAGATLTGNGKILGAVTNNGTVRPTALLTLGSYAQSAAATLAVQVSSAGSSQLAVQGTATLAGTLNASFDAGLDKAAIYPVIKAGSISGSFASFVTSGTSADMVYGVAYTPGEVDVVASPKSAGAIYANLVTAGIENATAMNDIALDHAAFDGCRERDAAVPCSGWSVWSQGIGGSGHLSGVAGFASSTWGVIDGVDYHFDAAHSLHGTFGYTYSKVSSQGGVARASNDGLFFSLAGHYTGSLVTVDADGFHLSSSGTMTRASGTGATIHASVGSSVSGFSLQLGYPLLGGDVTPVAKITYASLSYGPFGESGGSVLDLNAERGSDTSARFDLGVRLRHTFTTESGAVFRPSLLVAYEHDSDASAPAVAMRLASAANTDFTALGGSPDRDAAVIRLGVEGRLSDAWTVQGGVDGKFGARQEQALFHLSAAYRF